MPVSRENNPNRLVAEAEKEILDELAAVAAAVRSDADPEESDRRIAGLAILLMAICVVLTGFNVGIGAQPSIDAARDEVDALEALELFAGDIEAYRNASGSYPQTFENPFDDPTWTYERLADDHFRLSIARDDGRLGYDSKEGQARRELVVEGALK
ncbi:MAG: hypothetical protein GKS06_13185 [Acidobacteria bacterium]|nr:hypothetical protein [Acidobacteriota bacterium]